MKRVVAIALICAAGVASAQTDTAACRVKLTAATKDSDIVRVGLGVALFDSTRHVPRDYLAYLGDAIRQSFRAPTPLALDTYDGDSVIKQKPVGAARLTLRGIYRAWVHADGRITAAHVVSGTRTDALDRAILAAIDSASTQRLAPTLADDERSGPNDSIDVRIRVKPMPNQPAPTSADRFDALPLFAFRTPRREFTAATAPYPGLHAPRYPATLRDANVEGKVKVTFVVDADGRIRPGSLELTEVNAIGFAEAVVAELPSYRFYPMTVDKCPVASLVSMPFEFRLCGTIGRTCP